MDRQAKESRAKRFLVLLGVAALLALPAHSVSCSATPYADEYYLQVSLQESGGVWSERQVAVAIMLCDDRDDYRAPELKTFEEIQAWFTDQRERCQERFTKQRMEYIQVSTTDPKLRHKLLLSADTLVSFFEAILPDHNFQGPEVIQQELNKLVFIFLRPDGAH